jgi:hypothetical protein
MPEEEESRWITEPGARDVALWIGEQAAEGMPEDLRGLLEKAARRLAEHEATHGIASPKMMCPNVGWTNGCQWLEICHGLLE